MPTKALCGLAVRALAQPAALNEPMGLGLQPCGLSTASPPSGVGQGGAALAARCPSYLLRFYLMAPSRKLASRLEVGERGRTLKPLGRTG